MTPTNQSNRLARRNVVRTILQDRGNLLVVAGLGATAWDVAAVGDNPLDFPLWGAMGGASMIGLGLALAQPSRKILVLTGDGEMLMGLGSLATIAAQRPPNLRIVVIDNERFGETGQQLTHTACGTDLAAVARGCGFETVRTVTTEAELEPLRSAIHDADELLFAVVKVAASEDPKVLPPRDGAYLKDRFRVALLGTKAATD